MTPEELAAIRERDARIIGGGVTYTATQSERDRHVLLAEIDRLTTLLNDPDYLQAHRDGLLGLW